jgi:hypothetical protein
MLKVEDYTNGKKPKYAVIGEYGNFAYSTRKEVDNWLEIDTMANVVDYNPKKHKLIDWKRKGGEIKKTK